MTSARTRLALLLAAAALGGCAVVPAHDYGYDPSPAVTVYAAPPAPLVEYRGLPPAYGYVWLDGFWNWGGVHYSWVPGRWVSPPPGQVWLPRVWRRDGERWHAHGGHWEQRRDDHRLPPPPVWQRREHQSQQYQQYQRPPEPLRRQDWRSERPPEPSRHPSRDGAPLSAFARPPLPQPPGQAAVQPVPEPQRRSEGPLHRVLSEAQRMSPAVAPRPEPAARSADAAPQRRGGDEGRRMGRKWPEEGEPRDNRH